MLPTFDPVLPEARTGRADAVDDAGLKESGFFAGKSSDWGGITLESCLLNCIVSGALIPSQTEIISC
jgi:hypothetical protein